MWNSMTVYLETVYEFGVVLPADMRDFFGTINGLPDGTTDEEMIRFWTLQEINRFQRSTRICDSQLY